MNIKYLLLLILLSLPCVASAKLDPTTRNRLLKEAGLEYQSGKYDAARKIYFDIYVEDGDNMSHELMEKCKQCMTLLADAATAERNGQFSTAIEKYQAVMELNSTDKSTPTLIAECKQRLYAPKLQMAKQYYREGKYSEARDCLSEYTSLSGVTDAELLTAITEGITWSNEAKAALQNKDYAKAKQYLDRLLASNPTDAISARALAEVNSLSQTTKILYVEKPSTKKKIIPEKNCFSMRLVSGFDKTSVIGLYIGYNYKMFQIGVDFSVGKSCDDISDTAYGLEELNDNAILISENRQYSGACFPTSNNIFYGIEYRFFSPSLQFAISPGLNFKYFSIECGLGMITGTEYTCYVLDAYQGYQDGYKIKVYTPTQYLNNKKSSSRFFIRPTLTGYISGGKTHSGLAVSIGYNIVSGASSLNGIMFGVGFFV